MAGSARSVVRRAGTDERPLSGSTGVDDREAAAALRGEALLVPESWRRSRRTSGSPRTWSAAAIDGLGEVTRVVAGPSCDVLEVGDGGVLVPLVSDAVERIDLDGRRDRGRPPLPRARP